MNNRQTCSNITPINAINVMTRVDIKNNIHIDFMQSTCSRVLLGDTYESTKELPYDNKMAEAMKAATI